MAIGDEENDRAMLAVVGNPVVMENGNPELKKIAKYITKTMMNQALPMLFELGSCKKARIDENRSAERFSSISF